ncbi:SulP family inorganic anion transporter [Rhodoferax mekongensis]|uniref:SulP family inorganic anion transporter n=1 Tax=Rhodoferax mekongensis TaxID=3068341 RepID=UPI0028BEC880|nr:sulfate permease [Rhodoferax sp. TBRC 17199]MDT7514440.1 sulfate permease [Rhodoferax sp. TBRC 17199]
MALIPHWIQHYPRHHLRDDVLAGLVLTVLVIPQSLAYALLAGLPPQAGLYVSILPAIAYALLGSSMVQAVGPVAITAIMTYSVLSPIAQPGSAHYIQLAAWLSLSSGLLIAACGVARLGFLSQLLSRPVVSGFVAGLAVLIMVSQAKFILGVEVHGNSTGQTLRLMAQQLPNTNQVTLMMGLASIAALTISRVGLKRWPVWMRLSPLLVLLVSTLIVSSLDLDSKHAVAVVGTIRLDGMSQVFTLPELASLQALAEPTLLISFIGMVQCITMAQALAVKRRERVDANRQLTGLGAANIAAAFSGGMPVGGGLSRSAINVAAGAQTPLAGVVSGLSMVVLVLVGTEWLTKLPLAVLAASIVVAAWGMIDVRALRQAWGYDRADAIAWLGTALGVITLGLDTGIAMGIGLSLATLLWRSSAPHIAVLGRLPGTSTFRNVERYETETLPHALLLRIDESLFFGNLQAVEARLSQELGQSEQVEDVVLVMTAVNRVDTSAMEVLEDINRDLRERGIKLHFAEVKGPVQDRLMHTELWTGLSGQVFPSVSQAFQTLQSKRLPAADAALAI